MDETHWSLEEERQELIDGIHYLDPGDEDYDRRLEALEKVNKLIPEKDEKKIHWPKVIETTVPIIAGVMVTGLLEAAGLIFTSKGSFFWRK